MAQEMFPHAALRQPCRFRKGAWVIDVKGADQDSARCEDPQKLPASRLEGGNMVHRVDGEQNINIARRQWHVGFRRPDIAHRMLGDAQVSIRVREHVDADSYPRSRSPAQAALGAAPEVGNNLRSRDEISVSSQLLRRGWMV